MTRRTWLVWIGSALFSITLLFGAATPAHAAPVNITTCTQLQLIGSTTGSLSDSYLLGNNIDCSATATWNPIGDGGFFGFEPLGNFTGSFNGAGHTITGLYINEATSTDVGLFSEVSDVGTVENITLSNASISGLDDVGGLIGDDSGTVSNVNVTGSIIGNLGVGGLIGLVENTAIVSSSTADTSISGIEDGTSDPQYFGGLIGYSSGEIDTSVASGSIILSSGFADSAYIGGLIGGTNSAIATSSASVAITASGSNVSAVGGLVGYGSGTGISDSYATGNVTVSGANSSGIGGFVGIESSGPIINSYATGNVTGNNQVGGFAGANQDSVSDSYATGNVSLHGVNPQYGGGFAGSVQGNVTDAFSTGSVSVDAGDGSQAYHLGGFTGENDNYIYNAYSTGSVLSDRPIIEDIGGFAGESDKVIENSYSAGIVSGNTDDSSIGGFIGLDGSARLTNNAWALGTADFAIGSSSILSESSINLADNGYGTDEDSIAAFYSASAMVYAAGADSPWDFAQTWTEHISSTPTLSMLAMPSFAYGIIASSTGNGSISPSGLTTVTSGGSQTYSITPDAGYAVDDVSVDGVSAGAVSTYQFSDVIAPHRITASFAVSAPTPDPVVPVVTTSQSGHSGQSVIVLPNGHEIGKGTVAAATFTRDLQLGMTGTDVIALQKFLNTHSSQVATIGAGSPASETMYFGELTKKALAVYQKAHGIAPSAGYFGPLTRAYVALHP